MQLSMRRVTLACSFVVALLPATFPSAGEADPDLQSSPRTDAYLQAVLDVKARLHLPGVVAGVWIPGKKPWKVALGMGDVASGRALSLKDRFPIRSVTKSYTVTLVLQLARAKAISLDDPIGKYVPDLGEIGAVTLTQLAAMESGIKNYSDPPEFQSQLVAHPEKHWSPRELVNLALPFGLMWPPASRYDYSNTNTILLGMAVEAVAGRPIAEIYRGCLFAPLQMTHTSYPDGMAIPDPHPTPYIVNGATGDIEECPVVNLSTFGASGGMVTTLEDFHKWGRALGEGRFVGRRLQELRMEHSRPATSGPEYDRYGLGMGELKGWWGHTGEGLGYQACTFYDPRAGGVICVLLNSAQFGVNAAAEVFKALADVVHPPATEAAPTPWARERRRSIQARCSPTTASEAGAE
jgi:D-alanyl-D-alanine carboxypeptidase